MPPLILLPVLQARSLLRTAFLVQGPTFTRCLTGGVIYLFCSCPEPIGEDGLAVQHFCDHGMIPTPGRSYCAAKDRCADRWKPFIAHQLMPGPKGGLGSQVIIHGDSVPIPCGGCHSITPRRKTPGAVKAGRTRTPCVHYVADTAPVELRGVLIGLPRGPRWGHYTFGVK